MKKNLTQKQKKRMRRAIIRRRLLLLLLLVIIVTSICLFTPFFNIKNIKVVGNEVITSEQIIKAAAVPLETNLFRVNTRRAKKAILKIPEIESVKIKRKLFSTLQYNVVETKAVLSFPYLTGFAATNENGRVIAVYDSEEERDLLKITGLEIKNAEICEKISVQDSITFDIIISTIQKLNQKGLLPEIRSAHFDNLSEVFLYLKDGTKIIFGKTNNLDYKLSVLEQILVQVNRTEGAYIDLTTPERSVYGMLEPEEIAVPEGTDVEEAENSTEQPSETESQSEDENDTEETENSDERS